VLRGLILGWNGWVGLEGLLKGAAAKPASGYSSTRCALTKRTPCAFVAGSLGSLHWGPRKVRMVRSMGAWVCSTWTRKAHTHTHTGIRALHVGMLQGCTPNLLKG